VVASRQLQCLWVSHNVAEVLRLQGLVLTPGLLERLHCWLSHLQETGASIVDADADDRDDVREQGWTAESYVAEAMQTGGQQQ
jgi:hypothetical protein